MGLGKTFGDIYKDIFTKEIPKTFGAALTLPGKVVTGGIGLAAPVLSAPLAYKAFRDTAGMSRGEAINATLQNTSDMQKQFVGDAFNGDLVRKPAEMLANSRYPAPVKVAGIAGLKTAELLAASVGYQAFGQMADKAVAGYKDYSIKNSPIPSSLLNNEKKHAIDQIVGHPDTSMYFPQRQPAADALAKAIDESAGAPLKDFGKTVLEKMPKEFMKDANVATSVQNWVVSTNNMYEMIKMGIGSGMSFGQASFIGDKLRSVDKAYTPFLITMFKNLMPKKK